MNSACQHLIYHFLRYISLPHSPSRRQNYRSLNCHRQKVNVSSFFLNSSLLLQPLRNLSSVARTFQVSVKLVYICQPVCSVLKINTQETSRCEESHTYSKSGTLRRWVGSCDPSPKDHHGKSRVYRGCLYSGQGYCKAMSRKAVCPGGLHHPRVCLSPLSSLARKWHLKIGVGEEVEVLNK